MSCEVFENLYDFFNFVEFCPFCKGRTSPTVAFSAATVCVVDNKNITILDSAVNGGEFNINLFNNSINSVYKSALRSAESKIVFGKQCNKYHFFYNATANISKETLKINNIILDKYHFIRIHGKTHFTVNGSISQNLTNIRITTTDFKTKELTLPLIDFNLLSKRKIDLKLKNIQLLV